MQRIIVRYAFGFAFLWNVCQSTTQRISSLNNCTCKTSDGGIYSLWPLRRTDGKPRFIVPGSKYPGWRYTYNPCSPVNVGLDDPHASQICRDVALCKYAYIEDPREYFEIGLQEGFSCWINQKGQIELVYKTHDKTIDIPESRVVFNCDESVTIPVFRTEDEDNYVFSITHYCACKNQCSANLELENAMQADVSYQITELTQETQKPKGASIIPAFAAVAVIASVVVGVVLWHRYRNRPSRSLERKQLLKDEVTNEVNDWLI